MAEWSNVPDSKSGVPQGTVGSNPTLSASNEKAFKFNDLKAFFIWYGSKLGSKIMLSLPIYLRGSSYYLHTRINKKQIKKSLHTNNKSLAISRACKILDDMSTIKRFEINLRDGILKADGPEDHERLMEALDKLERLKGSTPSFEANTAAPAPVSKGLKLLDLLDKFFLLKSHLKQATVMSYKGTMEEFKDFLKNPFLQNIVVSDITRYQEHLAGVLKNTPRTIDNKVAVLRAMFNFAIKQGYFHDKNPAENRALQTKKEKIKGGWAVATKDEIELIYNSDQFKAFKEEDPDCYWTMVLAIVTGCRVSEITGLTTKQFMVSSTGINYITVEDAKTLAGIRDIPIPEIILNSGLLKFIENKDRVFKYKERLGKGSGNAVGKKFGRLLEELKITRPKVVFHSLRKFVNDFFMKNGVSFEARCQFIGHEFDHVNIQTYTELLTIDEMNECVKGNQLKIMMITGLVQTKF